MPGKAPAAPTVSPAGKPGPQPARLATDTPTLDQGSPVNPHAASGRSREPITPRGNGPQHGDE